MGRITITNAGGSVVGVARGSGLHFSNRGRG